MDWKAVGMGAVVAIAVGVLASVVAAVIDLPKDSNGWFVFFWIDIIGGFLFLLPICVILTYFTWPWFVESWVGNEASSNAGGLIRWPVKLLLPVGFALMALQGISEIIKRVAALEHVIDIEFKYEKPLQ